MSDFGETSTPEKLTGIGRPEEAGRPVVLQLLDNLQRSSVTRAAIDVAAAVQASGGTAILASGGGILEHELARIGAVHVTLPLDSRNPLTQRRNAARLAELIKKFDVDVVHAHARGPAWAGHAAAEKCERSFITTVHSAFVGERGLRRKLDSVMVKAERVVVPSEFIARHLRENFQLERSLLRLIPQGVDFLRFDPEQVTAQRVIQLATRWRLPDGLPVVTLADRLAPEWRHDRLIEALAKIQSLEFACLLIGTEPAEPSYRAALERRIQDAGLGGRVTIIDDCIDMPAAYMLSDVVASLPAEPEGFSRIVCEAQALGRVALAYDSGAASEQVIEGHTGFLVPEDDADALAGSIAKALQLAPEERQLISYASIGNARTNFSKERMCALHLGLYRELMRAGAYRLARDLPSGIHSA